jgi:chaperone modulatory protein CbpM
MSNRHVDILTGTVVETDELLSIEELGRLCAADAARIAELVEEGIVATAGGVAPHWRFAGGAVRRARVAVRLQRDLEINLAGVALALDLLDEIDALRRRLHMRG